ncbi:DUF5941 domain-containing protein [Nonomuraea sp. NPDC059194]|uniref:DUF5941 domain-containing protein n=1 Tax=Nonomuraea sp. NPDC059194 TaxID=3346764 RepID=UPI003679F323
MITQPQATATAAPDPDEERRRIQTARLLAYRDDGPLVHALAPRLGKGLPPVAMLLVALLATIGVAVAGLSPLISVAVMIVLVLPTGARDHLGRLDWLVPPLLRGTEFLIVILIGLAYDAPKWLLFVLLYVVGYHTYDTVYRTRQSIWPPTWVFMAGLGWEVRLLIIAAGAALGILAPVLYVLTGYLLVLFAVESVTSWVRLDKASAQAGADAEQDLEASPEEALEQATGEAEKA